MNGYSIEKNVQIIISLLKAHGISNIITSLGSTNVCLVASLQNDNLFKMYSSVDERSATYLACGLASETGEPVVLTCAETEENSGTLILDAICAPQNISFLQDVNLLNEAREDLEGIIDDLCRRSGHYTPRMYRQNARKDYMNLAKCKKCTS